MTSVQMFGCKTGIPQGLNFWLSDESEVAFGHK